MKYTRELARIKATQKAWEYKHHGIPTHTMTCEEWRDHRFNQLEMDGVKIEHGTSNGQEAWRLTNMKSKTVIVVPQAEIEADWKRCYLHQGVEA